MASEQALDTSEEASIQRAATKVTNMDYLIPRLRLQTNQIRHNRDYVKFTKEKLSFVNSYSKYP